MNDQRKPVSARAQQKDYMRLVANDWHGFGPSERVLKRIHAAEAAIGKLERGERLLATDRAGLRWALEEVKRPYAGLWRGPKR